MLSGGHTNVALWVGTNGANVDTTWAEVGATRGYGGQEGLYYYTAHGINYPTTGFYEDRLLTHPQGSPVGGKLNTFRSQYVFTSSGDAYDSYIDGYYLWSWYGHSPPTSAWASGGEGTCVDDIDARIGWTTTRSNQFRGSDAYWHYPASYTAFLSYTGFQYATCPSNGWPWSFTFALRPPSGTACVP